MIFLRIWTSRLLVLSALFAAIALAATFWIPLGRYHAQLRAVLQPFLPAPPTQKTTPAAFAYNRAAAPAERLRLRGCFTSEFDANWATSEGRTPLLVAALTQDWARFKNTVAAETVNAADATGRTALMLAARYGQLDAIRALLAAYANVNATDAGGRTAFEYALLANQSAAAEFLLPLTAEPLLRNMLAAAYDRADWPLIELLLNRLPQVQDWSPAAFALLQKTLDAADEAHARLLLSKYAAPLMAPGRKTPLLAQLVATGETRAVQTLLRCGADPNMVLAAPAEKQFLDSLGSRYLRDYVEGDTGITLLMVAAGLGRDDVVRVLLDAGADRNKMTAKYKMLALYFAARSKNYRCTQILLGSGPSPEELRIEINLAQQHAAVLKNGVAIFTTACSTGRVGFATPPGSYVITDKDKYHRSTIYKVPMPFFMRLSCRDFGMHEGVVSSPHASHGCIRLPSEAARKLFSEIPVGTVVQVD